MWNHDFSTSNAHPPPPPPRRTNLVKRVPHITGGERNDTSLIASLRAARSAVPGRAVTRISAHANALTAKNEKEKKIAKQNFNSTQNIR